MLYNLTVHYTMRPGATYYNLSLTEAVKYAKLAVASGKDFDIKEARE